jgi:RimJ/RimL family protein N-acetyltransferase
VELAPARPEAGRVLASNRADFPGWLPPTWLHPRRVELSTGHHLRPLRASDVDLHLRAVLESQERLWSIYGPAWQWPPRSLTVEQDREQLARREADAEQRRSYTYALFDLGETELLGCVDIDPGRGGKATAAVSWWVVDWLVDSPIEWALDETVPAWIAAEWPLFPCRGPVSRPTGW